MCYESNHSSTAYGMVCAMSPKTFALLKLYATIVVIALPGLPVVFASAGYVKLAAGFTLAAAIVGVLYHAYTEAISKLQDGDGNTGGSATTMGGKAGPKVVPPASPFRTMPLDVPAFARPVPWVFRLARPGTWVNLAGIAVVVGAVACVLVFGGCAWFKANGPTVVTDVAQVTNCVIAAVDAGGPDGGAVNLTSIASACGASTVDVVIQILDQTLASEQASSAPNQARILKLKALGADASRAKPVGDGGAP